MGHLRAVLRIPALAGVTATVYLIWLLTRPTGWISKRWGHATHFFATRLWGRTIARVLGLCISTSGTPPTGSFFLVSNHLSYLDIIVFFSHVDAFFIAKSDIARWPVLGFLARTTGTIFIDRARKSDVVRVISRIDRVLDSGAGTIVFPEGTSSSGESILPFKPSMFQAATKPGRSVSCASISYRTPEGAPPAHLAVCWWGDMTFAGHCYGMIGLPSIEAHLAFAERTLVERDRKLLAEKARRTVEELFTPVVGGA